LRLPNQLTAWKAAATSGAGALTVLALAQTCLERIAIREPEIRAWTALDPEAALARAREADAHTSDWPSHGAPVGINYLIYTADLPTTYGSPDQCWVPATSRQRPAKILPTVGLPEGIGRYAAWLEATERPTHE
jgi:Asp-tRNA(Asn)/Glu-tRNA(Gln) amidotransferase A subunit family amidase